MTPDIERLSRSLSSLESILEELELELQLDPNWSEPSPSSYLTAEDLANPDIVSNVEAMDATNDLISWFGRDREGFVGLWRGGGETPLESAPVVRLDYEGQYELVARTIGDYIAISVEDSQFQTARNALRAAGFTVADSREAVWDAIDVLESPNKFRLRLFNEARSRRGLGPV